MFSLGNHLPTSYSPTIGIQWILLKDLLGRGPSFRQLFNACSLYGYEQLNQYLDSFMKANEKYLSPRLSDHSDKTKRNIFFVLIFLRKTQIRFFIIIFISCQE